jgi:peptidoglycan hydrolase CwlO-like protein
LSEELNNLRNEVKTLKQRSSKCRIDNDRLQNKIAELEGRIDALI